MEEGNGVMTLESQDTETIGRPFMYRFYIFEKAGHKKCQAFRYLSNIFFFKVPQ